MSHMKRGHDGFRRLSVQAGVAGDDAAIALTAPLEKPAKRPRKLSASGRRRGKGAIQCFAADHDLIEFKEKGRVTDRYWMQLRRDFDSLPDERKAHYEAFCDFEYAQREGRESGCT